MHGFKALTFNVDGGYLEAIMRGHGAGLLTALDYNNLCQCENLNDIKMHLSSIFLSLSYYCVYGHFDNWVIGWVGVYPL